MLFLKKKNFFDVIFGGCTLACMIAAFWMLMSSPIKGAADNTDSQRFLPLTGLAYPQGHYYDQQYLEQYLLIGPADTDMPVTTSAHYFVTTAKAIYQWLNPGKDVIDIRAIGLVYLPLLVMAIFFLMEGSSSTLFAALVAYLILDPRYMLWSNSLFAETPVLLSILLLSAAFIYFKPEFLDSWNWKKTALMGLAFGAAALPGGMAKQQHLFLPTFALLNLTGLLLIKRKLFTRKALALIFPLLLASGVSIDMFQGPFSFTHRYLSFLYDMYKHQSVFMGIGRLSTDLPRDYGCLGLEPKYWSLTYRNLFVLPPDLKALQEEPEFRHFLKNLSYGKQLSCYLKNPVLIYRAIALSSEGVVDSKIRYHSSFTRSSPPGTLYEPKWAATRAFDALFQHWRSFLWILPLLALLLFGRKLYVGGSGRTYAYLFPFLVAYTLAQLFIITFGDGAADLGRQAVPARLCTQLLVLAVAAELWEIIWPHLRSALRWLKSRLIKARPGKEAPPETEPA